MAATKPSHRAIVCTLAAEERHNPGSPRIPALRGRLAAQQLANWAELAARLPALDQSDVAAVGAIAARLDARLAGSNAQGK